ncbi:uncharacterized protein LOC142409845 [Mycteria americana]|uniref:uncharacterized protein LOC142409845 n=1 Tax=Mycteria americana TaxID=33587 RepID=UPI003F58DDEB
MRCCRGACWEMQSLRAWRERGAVALRYRSQRSRFRGLRGALCGLPVSPRRSGLSVGGGGVTTAPPSGETARGMLGSFMCAMEGLYMFIGKHLRSYGFISSELSHSSQWSPRTSEWDEDNSEARMMRNRHLYSFHPKEIGNVSKMDSVFSVSSNVSFNLYTTPFLTLDKTSVILLRFIKGMVRRSKTTVDEFILLRITDIWELQVILFVLFFLICVTSLVGNLGMAALVRLDSQLHTPTYFFLCHLSLVDLGNSSAVAPKTLVSFFEERRVISLPGCAAQMYLCGVCIITECYLLAAMAYDRTMIFMYLPSSSSSPDQDKVVSVVYTLVIPMQNPLIYSLRNMEVKDALKRLLEKVLVSLRNQTGKEVS